MFFRCFETALNFAKLICSLDIQSKGKLNTNFFCLDDPLAMFLVLDTLAIKAKQYTWLNMLCRAYSVTYSFSLCYLVFIGKSQNESPPKF